MTASPPPVDPARELRQLVEAGRFREALDAHQRTEDPAVRARPEVELLAATAATRLGELGRGISLAESALERFRTRADDDGRMRALNLLGVIAFENGRLEDAERSLTEALDLARLLDDTRMTANASNNLASVAHLRSRGDAALSLYRSALLSYQRLGDRRGTAQTYHNLGLLLRQRQEWGQADSAALQAVRHAEAVGEGSLMALAAMGRAELHIEQGALELARSELSRAEQLAREVGDEVGLAELGRLRARFALQEGNPELAAELALSARDAALRLGILQLQAEAVAAAAVAFHRLGQASASTAHRDEALRIFESLGAVGLGEALTAELDN